MMERTNIAGSERNIASDARVVGAIDPAEIASVTVVVRARRALDPSDDAVMDRATYAETYGADPADLAAVENFARAHGLTVTASDIARRSVVLEGPLGVLADAFGTRLALYARGNERFRGRSGPLSLPAPLAAIVVGVFGLDDRPQARAQFRRSADLAAVAAPAAYTPLQIANAYDFPAGLDGTGQTIALIELGGGFVAADLATYFSGLGLATPSVVAVGVDGAANAPTGDPAGPDGEVMLDIEVAGAIAPGARIVVYFAPNTDRGFLDAITTAVHDTTNAPSVVSISWGGSESTWTAQALKNFDDAFAVAAMLGVTIVCAAGDNGSSDGVADGATHVDFPSSSPHALACGGTRLDLNGTTIAGETVWNDGSGGGATGGGISTAFPRPDWQVAAGVPATGRGVPDVAGDADPQTGYAVFIDGGPTVVGGTSAVAPLYAALIARINQKNGKPAGFINPTLYATPSAFRDIVTGSNGAFKAGPGWDPCTGLGSPDGTRVAAALGAGL